MSSVSTVSGPLHELDAPADEVALATPEVAQVYAAVQSILDQLPGGLNSVSPQAKRMMQEFGPPHVEHRPDERLQFDPIPRVLSTEDWALISRGILQRLTIWNALFNDLYDGEEILKTGILPFELVYDDPRYQRPAVGVRVPNNTYVHVAAFDLARDARGQWIVLDDDVSLAFGAGFALHARNVLGHVVPTLLGTARIHAARSYPAALLEHLQQTAVNTTTEPRVVLLCSRTYDQWTIEQSFLARQMGVPLVRCGDLIVLNTKVYLKTIGGLEAIDVIYRRFSDRSIDPLGLASHGSEGVPGLMSCVRKGTVAIANAIGTGLGENRAISAYIPKLARFYTGEALQLPSIPRLLCFDPDQCEEVLANVAQYQIRNVHESDSSRAWIPSAGEQAQDELRRQIKLTPSNFVAESLHPLTLLPSLTPNYSLRPGTLRVFAFGGKSPAVIPLALTILSPENKHSATPLGNVSGLKDTWILKHHEESEEPRPIRVSPSHRRIRLGSRTADSFFWIGRYAERAETTSRILRILRAAELEDPAHHDTRHWTALWESLARATGHPTHFFKRSPLPSRQSISYYLMLDRQNRSSAFNCVAKCRDNALSIRESVAPEVWAIINKTFQLLSDTNAIPSNYDDPYGISELQENLIEKLDSLTGAALKHMLRDGGWHFWNLGIYLERAITTVLVTRQCFVGNTKAQRKNPSLEPLLQMLSCLYAHRSLFQSRPSAETAVTLVLQDQNLPHSLLYCLQSIHDALITAFGDPSRELQLTPAKLCQRLQAAVAFKELAPFFTPPQRGRQPSFTRWLDEISASLHKLSLAISDHYLHHQAINVLR